MKHVIVIENYEGGYYNRGYYYIILDIVICLFKDINNKYFNLLIFERFNKNIILEKLYTGNIYI